MITHVIYNLTIITICCSFNMSFVIRRLSLYNLHLFIPGLSILVLDELK
ncbi:hypothetical protein HMPREF1981_01505 [Bacteroides pyogenes F0041]|uniref:Uncharacterized protein n=1 Tax=Bacteroides pyogenes F0041 TaxID=1321819 RepID=U2CM76_9BACE|nr:hypothetical protein HMPREF1981_01505 [Bacteroides pyogenes F0041]